MSVNFEQVKLKKIEKKSFSATKLATNLYSSMKQKKSMNLQNMWPLIMHHDLFYAFSKKYIKELVQYKNKMKENDENVIGSWKKLRQNIDRKQK